MTPKEFYDNTEALIDEIYAYMEDKDISHKDKYWEQVHILKAEIDRVREILKKRKDG